jgi:hypothetical protein
MGTAARQRAGLFTESAVVPRVEAVYRELAGQARPAPEPAVR